MGAIVPGKTMDLINPIQLKSPEISPKLNSSATDPKTEISVIARAVLIAPSLCIHFRIIPTFRLHVKIINTWFSTGSDELSPEI